MLLGNAPLLRGATTATSGKRKRTVAAITAAPTNGEGCRNNGGPTTTIATANGGGTTDNVIIAATTAVKQQQRKRNDDVLSQAIYQGLRQLQLREREQEKQRRRLLGNGGDDNSRRRGGNNNKRCVIAAAATVTPTLRHFRTYCHIIQQSVGTAKPEITFPSVATSGDCKDDNDRSMFRAISRVSNTTDVRGGGFFDEAFAKALKSAFSVLSSSSSQAAAANGGGRGVSFGKIQNQINGHVQACGVYRKWSDWYQRTTDLGLLDDDKGAPIVISLSLFATTASGGANAAVQPPRRLTRFVQETDLRPISLNNLGCILFAKERSSSSSSSLKVDSLRTNDLTRLGARSIYYRRVYLTHLLIYATIYESVCNAARSAKHPLPMLQSGNNNYTHFFLSPQRCETQQRTDRSY